MAAITSTEARPRSARRGQLLKLASRAVLAALLAIATPTRLQAHDPGLSALDVRVEMHEIVALLSLSPADGRAARSLDGVDIALDDRSVSRSATSVLTDANGVRVRMVYRRPAGSRLVISSRRFLEDLPRGHRQLLTIHSSDGGVIAERMLDAEVKDAAVDLSAIAAAAGSPFAYFFALGVAHILTGYDHLLFLAGVLVVLRRWRHVVQTITSFTLAHSLTLALATAGLLVVPSRLVEPLIAASIVYVGIENLFRATHDSRWKVTFGFGLIHGLGFATALRDLGVGSPGLGGIAVPLASFNAGVEAGQMAVAGLLIPIFWWLGTRPSPRIRFARAWSLLVALAGGYWLIERMI